MESAALDVGDRYIVTWRNGQKQPGEIIEKRFIKKSRESLSGPGSTSSSSSLSGGAYEYYIHFPNFDRRLDEWVTIDRIDVSSAVTADGDDHGKLKKNSKRLRPDDGAAATTNTACTANTGDSKKEEKEILLASLEKEHEEITKVKNIQSIVLGKYDIETWYFSPYPEEYCGEEKIFICEFCLKYMKRKNTLRRHFEKCLLKSPPGKEIYREKDLTMYEIDGKDHKIYCQNLCLLSKLFLDHKTLYYDVDPFLFYVMCEVDSHGSHIVGYFSKEKHSQENYNLACILTFPPYQRKGYGKFLISISYELTKRENTTGSPEKPLSDLGKISYRSYWAYSILNFLANSHKKRESITINDICKMTGIRQEDILSTLHSLNLIKYWKGQHVISILPKVIETQLGQSKKIRLCDPVCLTWIPPEKTVKKGV